MTPAVRAGSRVRRRALEILHAADVNDVPPAFEEDDGGEVRAMVNGVVANRAEIDDTIGRAVEHWSLERMPVVDRNLLRLGIYELTKTRAPVRAIVNDAVNLAKQLSTQESGRFVNGVLARIAREVRG